MRWVDGSVLGMLPAAVALPVVMVLAGGVRVVPQLPRQQLGHRLVGLPGDPGVKADARLVQGGPGPRPDAAADEDLRPLLPEEPARAL